MPEKRPLDRIDFALLGLLQNDARLSNKELAAEVGLAPSSCLERVRRLRSGGHLRGFHADVDPTSLGIELQALLFVELATHSRRTYNAFRDEVGLEDEVVSLYNVAGRHDFVLHVAVRDTHHLREFALDRLTSRGDVRRIETSLIFEHQRTPLPNFRRRDADQLPCG
jgi:DNA-binding Lrp family transcriptional regulator